MYYEQIGDRVVVYGQQDFDIGETLECGQCFRYHKLTDKAYILIAHHKVIQVVQTDEQIVFYHTTKEEFEKIWIPYFDLDRDYGTIKQGFRNMDEHLENAVLYAPGIHILRQDPWECLISFIISQNKQIPHIRQVIHNLSERYGQILCTKDSCDYYSFPTAEELMKASESGIRACKAGFRAPYIVDACEKVLSKEVDLQYFPNLTTEEARQELLKIKGVGPKIADCVLLFSAGRYEVFPTDVWVKRVIECLYLKKEVRIQEIHRFAADYFGNLGGFAQQYLFYYARELKIGK